MGGIAKIIEDAICLGSEYVSKYASVNEMATGDFAEVVEAIG